MTLIAESSPPRSRVEDGFAVKDGFAARLGFVARCALLVVLAAPLAGQGPDRTTDDANFVKTPGGTVLGRIMRGAAVTFGATDGAWREVTLEGWVTTGAVRADARDGFDVSIRTDGGAPMRTNPASAAPVRAMAGFGALFDRLEARSGWVHLRRKGWMPLAATQTTPQPAAAAAAAPPPPSPAPLPDSGEVAVQGGAVFSAVAGGAPVGQLEVTRRVELLERRDGWNRVQMEVWVRDAQLRGAPSGGPITAAAILADPDRYIGETVEWSLQVLAVQRADELRPELPPGQPYVLARGPLPETGFVYLVVRGEQVAEFNGLSPLAEVRVRATVRAGRTRYLPTPVLDLVRRLD